MVALKLTDTPIRHHLYTNAHKVFGRLVKDVLAGTIIVLVGPTQCGKSLLLEEIYREMLDGLDKERIKAEGIQPYVYLQIRSTREGRVRMGWLLLALLKALRQPMYVHMHEMDEPDHYIPSRARSETAMANSLEPCVRARKVKTTILDESHLLTRTDNPELRGNLLEALKSGHGIERAIVLVGGYELLYKGLFDSPHFLGRCVFYDFDQYHHDIDRDLLEWRRILKVFSARVPLAHETLLDENAETLLRVSHGVVGLMEKWLWHAKVRAEATGKLVDLNMLRLTAPSAAEQKKIAEDIAKGKEKLKAGGFDVALDCDEPKAENEDQQTSVTSARSSASSREDKPFKPKPKRFSMNGFEIVDYA